MNPTNPMNPTIVLPGVQEVIYPDDTSSQKNFAEAIQIRWPNVVEKSSFHLCVGTDAGKWDILSEDVGKKREYIVDLSHVPAPVQKIYAQLITIGNGMNDNDESTAGEIIKITR